MSRQEKLAAGLTLLVAAAIAVLTLMPLSSPQIGGIEQSDKIYHALAFAALAFPIALLQPRWLVLAVPFFAAFGGIIEIVQPFVGRECSLTDWLADLVGVALGVVAGRATAVSMPVAGRLR